MAVSVALLDLAQSMPLLCNESPEHLVPPKDVPCSEDISFDVQ